MIDVAQLTLGQRLGKGGEGEVFLAVDAQGRPLAVKVLRATPALDRERFFERALAFSPLPVTGAVLPILAFESLAKAPAELRRQLPDAPPEALWLVLPFVEGVSLAELSQKPLTLGQVAAALHATAHALTQLPAGLAHGDVRASNVFVLPGGTAVLTDPDLQRAGSAAEDLQALGRLGQELLRLLPQGTPATAEERAGSLKLQGLLGDLDSATPPSAEKASAQLDRIVSLLSRGLSPQSTLSELVARALAGRPALARPKPAPRPVARATPKKRQRWPVVVGALLGALAIAAFAFQWLTRTPPLVTPLALEAVGGLYDQTGTVSYPETLHVLKDDELVAATDGVIIGKIQGGIPRVAISAARGHLLWESKQPPMDETLHFDVKPGHYVVEIDRRLATGEIQYDPERVLVDLTHPFRFEATNEMLYAPTRPADDGG